MSHLRTTTNREAGFALLMVILGLAIISVLALGLILATRSSIQEASSSLKASQMQAIFDAVILQASVALLSPNQAEQPRVDGIPILLPVLGQTVPVTITSEFGKVDINAADDQTLTRLFIAVGLGPDVADHEAQMVIQWRGLTGGRHMFRETSELTCVLGITPALYTSLAPAITVYSGRDRIDEKTASLLALEAYGMDTLTAKAVLRNRLDGQNASSGGELEHGRLIHGISLVGWTFRVDADLISDGNRESASAVFRMTGDPLRPILTLYRNEQVD